MPARFQLREIIDSLGLTQSEVARRAGVSYPTINAMYGNRATQVLLETLDKVATAIGKQPGDLIVRAGNEREGTTQIFTKPARKK